jgi:phosphomannomutase
VHITPTGFKHFRPFLQRGGTMLAYEESDGLTIAGHSLDKDGVVTGLLALRIVLHYRRSLSDLLAEIEREIGKYHWEQITFVIDISAREALKKLAKLAEYQPGRKLQADGRTYTLVAVDAQDGYKFFFEDGSWVMMRPSGTEPKVRVYAETRESPAATRTLSELGKRLALEAIHD